MHEYLRLIERIGHQHVAQGLPRVFVTGTELDAEMLFAQPVVKQR